MSDFYQVLGVAYTATQEQITTAYHAVMKQCHPDMVPAQLRAWAEARSREVNEAYETLSDPSRRLIYDMLTLEPSVLQARVNAQQPPPPPPPPPQQRQERPDHNQQAPEQQHADSDAAEHGSTGQPEPSREAVSGSSSTRTGNRPNTDARDAWAAIAVILAIILIAVMAGGTTTPKPTEPSVSTTWATNISSDWATHRKIQYMTVRGTIANPISENIKVLWLRMEILDAEKNGNVITDLYIPGSVVGVTDLKVGESRPFSFEIIPPDNAWWYNVQVTYQFTPS